MNQREGISILPDDSSVTIDPGQCLGSVYVFGVPRKESSPWSFVLSLGLNNSCKFWQNSCLDAGPKNCNTTSVKE